MPTLSEYANVYNTMLVILKEKGYDLWFSEKSQLYYAQKDGWDFAADSPCALLGLVAAFEHEKPSAWSEYWWRKNEPKLLNNLPTTPPEYESVTRRRT